MGPFREASSPSQKRANRRLENAGRHARGSKDLFDFGSEQYPSGLNPIVKCSGSLWFTRGKQTPALCIPDDESKVADNVGWAFLTPALVGREDYFGVGGGL